MTPPEEQLQDLLKRARQGETEFTESEMCEMADHYEWVVESAFDAAEEAEWLAEEFGDSPFLLEQLKKQVAEKKEAESRAANHRANFKIHKGGTVRHRKSRDGG